jgi:hypothetical protein
MMIQGRYFAWAALVVAGLVTLQELTWLGRNSLARVIAALGLSVVLLAVSVLTGKQAK